MERWVSGTRRTSNGPPTHFCAASAVHYDLPVIDRNYVTNLRNPNLSLLRSVDARSSLNGTPVGRGSIVLMERREKCALARRSIP